MTRDLAFIWANSSGGAASLTVRPSDGGKEVTGKVKMAQQFLACLLTRRGSALSDPEYGTDFSARVALGLGSNREMLPSVFAECRDDALRQISSDENADPDARIISVDLAGYTVTGGFLVLKMEMVAEDGESVGVTIPVAGGVS